MSVGEYEHEPVRGLPEYLPEGEKQVWQGAPDWLVMARQVFHVRTVAIYFALLIAVHMASQLSGGAALGSVLLGSGWQLGLGLAAICILLVLARAYAGTTVYTLTNKRLVIRSGVAMPMMVNIPLELVISADLRAFSDGSGDIVLTLDQQRKPSYLLLWPNVRPWHFSQVKPALRSISDVRAVAESLATVVAESEAKPGQAAQEVPTAATESERLDRAALA